MTRSTVLGLVLGLSLPILACGTEEDDAPFCGEQDCTEKCESLTGDGCDVRERACRARILQAVRCVRGTRGEMPEVRIITPEEYRQELEPDADAGVLDDPDAAAAEPEPWSTGLRLLGLLSPDANVDQARVDSSLENVGGYYDSTSRQITLLDRGRPQDSANARELFAHELVHALQDQELGLADLRARTGEALDSSLAVGCLIEGEAELYGYLASSLLDGVSIQPSAWDVPLERSLKYSRRAVITAESPWAAVWRLRYPIGARYVVDAWLDGGNGNVKALYRAPPISSAYWIHGYDDAATRDELLVLPLACTLSEAPVGFERGGSSRTGPLVVLAFLGQSLRDRGVYETAEAWRDALAWRQDQLSVFTSTLGATAVSWRMRFDDAATVVRLATELARVPGISIQSHPKYKELEVRASDDASVLEAWAASDPDRCPVEAP